DYRGGGRSSGRETAMRVAAGSVAKQLLAHYGVTIQAYTLRLGGVDAAKV
ncbi:MAG TPA: chorismate synthase, partial [Lentisphaeria bacterium]|nr:chorismate synthase [Lentisphaeria bacterium]